ncbi:hypothetical protein B9Z55_011488 [Caenorhabditis nigoni]|uniref:Homeobox domain-containing protein n=1 Tax=Caenorhabditis nigoni TaxID=1611254 RepID=A0A2G5UK91_9PELO|nr:hypothetical protein B9Z55_011488 [Caenorhabditis nigoni]
MSKFESSQIGKLQKTVLTETSSGSSSSSNSARNSAPDSNSVSMDLFSFDSISSIFARYLSPLQSEALEQQFAINKHLTPEIQAELARRTNLTESEVKIWFQDRRIRQEREENECNGKDTDSFVKNYVNLPDASKPLFSFEAKKLPENFGFSPFPWDYSYWQENRDYAAKNQPPPDHVEFIGVNGNSKGSAEGDGLSLFGSPSMRSGHISDSPNEGFHGERNDNHGPQQSDGDILQNKLLRAAKMWKARKLLQEESRLSTQGAAPSPLNNGSTLPQSGSSTPAPSTTGSLLQPLFVSSRPTTAAGFGGGSSSAAPAPMLKEEDPKNETSNQAPESVKDVQPSEKPSVGKCKETATDSNSGDTSDGFAFDDKNQQGAAGRLIPNEDKLPVFLIKLWTIVEDTNLQSIVHWDESGASFHIADPDSFCRNILPHFFKHNNLNSLIRQLNEFGFRKMTPESDQDHLEFSHPYFVQGRPELLSKIKRKKPSKETEGKVVNEQTQQSLDMVMAEMRSMREMAKNMEDKMNKLTKENRDMWNEMESMRRQHEQQQPSDMAPSDGTFEKKMLESANDRQQNKLLLAAKMWKTQKQLEEESRLSTQGAAPSPLNNGSTLPQSGSNTPVPATTGDLLKPLFVSSTPTTAAGFDGGSSTVASAPMLKEEDPIDETSNQASESVKDVQPSKKPSAVKCKEMATDSNSGDTSGVNGFAFHDSMSSLLARLTTGNGNQNSGIRKLRDVGLGNLSPLQSHDLEQQFSINKELTPEIQAELARRTNLTESEVKIWFQDRQYRQRRERNNEAAKKARFLKNHCKCLDSMSSGPATAAGTVASMLKEEDPKDETSNQAPESVKDVKKPYVEKHHPKQTTFGISNDASKPLSWFEASKLPEEFSRHQIEVLQRTFIVKQFLTRFERKQLAEKIGLNERQVRTWFQNRRREEEDKQDGAQPKALREEQGWYEVAQEISDFSKMMVPVALLIFLVCMIVFMLTALFK